MKRHNYRPFDTAVICSKHFLSTDYVVGGRIRRLKEDSVPTIFDFSFDGEPRRSLNSISQEPECKYLKG